MLSSLRGVSICHSRASVRSVRSASGAASQFHPRFVRENTWEAWDTSSRQRLDFNLDPAVGIVSKEAVPGNLGAFRVQFSDGHVGRFDPPLSADQVWSRDLPQWPKQLWGSNDGFRLSVKDISGELGQGGALRFDHDSLCEDGEVLRNFAEAMQVYGITMVQGVPVQEDAIIEFGNRTFGYVSPSCYGYKFTIKAEENPNNLAYSDKGIQQHTDLPYYSLPPSIQMFHCLTKAREGGESFFLDAFDTATALWEQDPRAFEVLCQQQVRFQDLALGWHHSAQHPTFLTKGQLSLKSPPELKRVCFNERARDSWRSWGSNGDDDSISQHEFYESLTNFERLVEDHERYVKLLLEPGEMICVDNWRLMHSRGSFNGARHFEGAYLDWDAVYAVWRAKGTEFSMPPLPQV